MILFHRLTPAAITLLAAGSYALLFLNGRADMVPVAICFGLMMLLLARLLKFEVRSFSFWVFFGVPFFFVISSFLFFLFLESTFMLYFVMVSVVLGLWLYTENLFTFYYLPGSYQAYALEYLTMVLYVVSAFFFTSSAFAAQLFLQLPVWLPSFAVFLVVLCATIAVFWVSKVSTETTTRFALSGAMLLTEMYIALSFLPTSFLTNAALFCLFLYLFLGMSRAHVLEKLTRTVVSRYVGIAGLLLLFVIVSARWV